MSQIQYRYCFNRDIAPEDVEAALLLARVAAESVLGEAAVKLDSTHSFNREHRACVILVCNDVGQLFNRVFYGLAVRQFGERAFSVERSESNGSRGRPKKLVA